MPNSMQKKITYLLLHGRLLSITNHLPTSNERYGVDYNPSSEGFLEYLVNLGILKTLLSFGISTTTSHSGSKPYKLDSVFRKST